MTTTYDCIATTTLSSAQSTVTFSNISANYTDLFFVCQIQMTNNIAVSFMTFNGDTGSNYSVTRLYGNGSNAVSDRYSNQTGIDFAYTSTSGWLIATVSLMNYSNTTTFKSLLGRWNSEGNSNFTMAWTGLWRSTSAINQITVKPNAVNFASGSTFSLYGIKSEV